MRTGLAGLGTRARVIAAVLAGIAGLGGTAVASTSPPHDYYLLSPEPLSGALSVMSLEPNNTITFGGQQLTLQQYETATLPSSAFTAGTKFSGTGFFTLGSNENAADLLVPDDFAGTAFVVPHIAGSHKYFLLSPAGNAQVTIRIGANVYPLTANQGIVNEFDAGSDNGVAGRITSDVPIVVTHVAYVSGSARDAYPVQPAGGELFGVRSQNTLVAALNDGTSVTVYASNGTSASHALDAGQQVGITIGAATDQGQGNALHIVASAPVAAVQYDDGDGIDATAFWTVANFGRRHGLPVNAQYLAVVCDQASVALTLYKGQNAPETQTCSGSSTTPGKAYFGASTSGTHLAAGWYLISSSPVYAMYEAAAIEDENNVLGLIPNAGPTAPTLNTISSPTTNNPQSVSGTAGANQTVRLYVNGLLQATATANGAGAYTFNAALVDGTNTLYATAVVSGNESDPSNAVSVTYNNTIPRNQSGTVSGTVVWTPGNPAQAYTVTAADLTIAAGAQLILQPGTQVRFGSGRRLTVNGTLKVSGTSGSNVVLTSDLASPTRGSWVGLVVNSTATNVSIERATIEWAQTAISVTNTAATIRNNTIRYFSANGVLISGASASGSLVQGNLIDNLNDTVDCIEVNASSPQIVGNTLTNCANGLHVFGASTSSVNGNNVITSNTIGVRVNANLSNAALPVVTGNQIHTNATDNYLVSGFSSGGSGIKLNATANWWGFTDPTAIGNEISDLTDNYTSSLPTVDYSNLLDGPNGSPVPGNYLIGPFSATSTTLTGGTTYDVLGTLFVSSGKSLTVPAGAVLRFHGADTQLVVDGTLTIQGTAAQPVVLTSGRATPARDDWTGVRLRVSGSLIEHARIEYMSTGVNVMGVTVTVRNTEIRYFQANGVYVGAGAGAAATVIQDNYIDNLNDTVDCIEINASSPQIVGNTLTNCANGLHVFGASTSSVNGNNIITSNTIGVRVNANLSNAALPVVTGNQIHTNATDNYLVSGFSSGGSGIKLNATGNWWGFTDPTAISNEISDLTDNYTSNLPTVDYSNFLDGPNGSPVIGNYLIGPLSAASTTLTGGTTYDVLGTLFVSAGKSLTVPAGAVLRFHGPDTQLVVDGTLSVQGTSTTAAVLTSGRATPARGDWSGIRIRTSGALIEYARIEYASTGVLIAGVAATVRNSTIRYFENNGVYADGAGAGGSVIQSNLIDNLNDTGDCIETINSSPSITGNTLTNCSRGLNVFQNSSPTVTGNNVITGNLYGIQVNGNNSFNPAPVVNGNQIQGNTNFNYQALQFTTSGSTLVLNARNNWWGTTDPVAIGNTIADLTDTYTNTRTPTVDYSSFLDGPSGSPVPGNYLIGPFSAPSTTLTGGTTYDVLGTLFVSAGKSLTIPAGVILRFHGSDTQLVVDGTLSVQGTSTTAVVLTSGRAIPARADWSGVRIRANGSLIEYARIEYTATAVLIDSVTATVRNSTLRYFENNGVYADAAGAGGSVIQGNLIDNLNDTGDCIETINSSPSIIGNTLTNCSRGLNVYQNSSPSVTGNNVITGNLYGIQVNGLNITNPAPVVNGNQIHSNTNSNYQATQFTTSGSTLVLNARNNWWGATNPVVIQASIDDLTDNYTNTRTPTVDWSSFLDGSNGSPVPGNYLIGPLAAASTTLTGGTTYDVLGTLFVPASKSLTIPAGAVLRLHGPDTRLVVDGTLTVQGTANSKVRLTSGLPDPGKGAWQGIEVRATATAVLIDHAIIEYAVDAIAVTSANVTISNSIIQNFASNGIRLTNVSSSSQITGNYIDNIDGTGNGINLSASSPSITGNQIYRTSIGIFASGASNPTITGNAISNNGRGIVLDGNNSNSASAVPNPVITGNDIFGNTLSQLDVHRYGASNPVVINATNNWWGTATPQAGQHIRFTSGSPSSTLNFTNPATGPQAGPVSGNLILSHYYFSPNGDSVKDTTAVSGTLNQSANWTITIRDPGYGVVRTYVGSGTAIAATWDGQNGSGQLMPDGIYNVEVTATGAMGSAIVGVRLAALDNTAPTTSITSPPASAVVNLISVPVVGTASDSYLVNFLLQYGAGTTPSSWTTINTQTASVSGATLGNWVVGGVSGTGGLPSGAYVLRLSTSDKAGNTASSDVPVTLDLLTITAITQNRQLMKPLLGEQLQVGFTLSAPATAFLRIYPESGGALVKEISQVFTSAGAQSLTWDGRHAGGAFVADEAYSFAIHASDGVRTADYDPPAPGTIGSGSGTVDSSFNAHKNDFWKMNYTMNHFGRIRMQVAGCGLPGTHYPYNWVPYPPGVHPLMWDGRGPDGQMTSGSCNVYFDAPLRMKANSVIVRGSRPTIAGTGSPSIEVKSNPHRITHSYEHVSKITYRVDQDSYVTVKLLPPGISDPASPLAIVLTSNELKFAQSGGQPADHVLQWKGYEDLDTNNILVSEEGSYTFAIQATSTVTGATALYRGALQLWQ